MDQKEKPKSPVSEQESSVRSAKSAAPAKKTGGKGPGSRSVEQGSRSVEQGSRNPKFGDPKASVSKPTAMGRSKRKARANAERRAEKNPGIAAREAAVALLTDVLHDGLSLSEAVPRQMAGDGHHVRLDPRDKAFARRTAAIALRWARPLRAFFGEYLNRPIPPRHRRVELILLAASAQILEGETPAHAVINLAVEQARARQADAHLDGMVNAVLRRVSETKEAWDNAKQESGTRPCFPDWMWNRWEADYGAEQAAAIAKASLTQAALDITVRAGDPGRWAERLGGQLLASGSVRLNPGGRVEDLTGFRGGAWWVQDAASGLPARLLGDIADQTVLDLCAAPGGKTAQLAAARANVVAVDVSEVRLERTRTNLQRLMLKADLVTADITTWKAPEPAPFVLLDAPCSATGTIRRHPDILHLKRESDQAELADLQARMLDAAFANLRPGGTLIYCTCALERAEGEDQIAAFLARKPHAARKPIAAGEAGIPATWINTDGDVRLFPTFTPPVISSNEPAKAAAAEMPPGIDGFFIARLTRV